MALHCQFSVTLYCLQDGKTALTWASEWGHTRTVTLLKDALHSNSHSAGEASNNNPSPFVVLGTVAWLLHTSFYMRIGCQALLCCSKHHDACAVIIMMMHHDASAVIMMMMHHDASAAIIMMMHHDARAVIQC
jgi:hypothetical protein